LDHNEDVNSSVICRTESGADDEIVSLNLFMQFAVPQILGKYMFDDDL
jgi:hypothetical protein